MALLLLVFTLTMYILINTLGGLNYELCKFIDHTLLKPDSTRAQVDIF